MLSSRRLSARQRKPGRIFWIIGVPSREEGVRRLRQQVEKRGGNRESVGSSQGFFSLRRQEHSHQRVDARRPMTLALCSRPQSCLPLSSSQPRVSLFASKTLYTHARPSSLPFMSHLTQSPILKRARSYPRAHRRLPPNPPLKSARSPFTTTYALLRHARDLLSTRWM